MGKRLAWIALAAVYCLAVPALAGECTETTEDCLCYFAQMRDRGFAGLDLAPHENDAFMTVIAVYNDTPAQRAGILLGDELVAIAGIRFSDDEETMEKIRALMVPDRTVRFLIVRDGSEQDLELVLTRMPDDVFYRVVGEHMLDHADAAIATR